MNRRILLPLLAALVAAASLGAATTADPAELLPAELEIELALSALPPHLRDGATVYRFGTDRRYEVARRGTNGFHAFVSRDDPNVFFADWPFTAYRDDILVPIAFDAAGARAHMRVFFDTAELRAAGIAAPELKEIMHRRYESGYYGPPERPGLSYMLAPVVRTYVDAEGSDLVATWNVPHYMFYAPGVSNDDIGGKPMSQHPYLLNREPGPHGYIIKFVGEAEKKQINEAYADMILRLCEVREL
ncbi:MAG: hypothetical protein MI919_16155, partial [Holophagales bacterium]|nr:hypothetical protein [Holophagales bacterium]